MLRSLSRRRTGQLGDARREVDPAEGLLVVGTLSAPSGMSEGARLMVADRRRRGIPVSCIDLTRELGQPVTEICDPMAIPTASVLPQLPRIVHLNPPHFGRALRLLGETVFTAPVVGYWAWELEQVPRSWRTSLNLVDEIWVPSPFVRDAILRALESASAKTPRVRVVPHAVEAGAVIRRDPVSRDAARSRLGFDDKRFVAGFTFSMLAGIRRKNPEAIIAVFRTAFPADQPRPALLLRCVDPQKNPPMWKKLIELARGDGRVHLSGASDCDLHSFFSAIDVLLSLHRAEGYGLTLAEALRADIPVIATAWGLSPEISGQGGFHGVPYNLVAVHDPSGPYARHKGSHWAEPDLMEAASQLRRLNERHAASLP